MKLRLGDLAVAMLALVVCSVVVAKRHFKVDGAGQFTLIDDAMISLRFTRNLAEGHGLVWNVGEPPIEGFTNLGYTVMMVPGFAFGDTIFARYFPVLLTTLGFIATTLLTAAITRAVWPNSRVAPVAAGAMVALNYGLIFWSSRGMETPLVTAAVLAMVLQFIRWRGDRNTRRLWLASLWGAIAIVIRLDSLAIVLVAGLWLVLCETRGGQSVRRALIPIGVAIATTIAVLGFQAFYFGDPLPNTYRLKVDGVSVSDRVRVGWDMLDKFAGHQLLVLLVLGPILLAIFSRSTLRNANFWLLVLIAAVAIGYSVWVGGDYIEPNRFIIMAIPALCVLAGAGMDALSVGLQAVVPYRASAPVLGVIAVALVFWPKFGEFRTLFDENGQPYVNEEQRTALGLHLRATLPPDATIATQSAGQIPYYSKLRTIDLLGKADREIASMPQTATRFRPGHSKWNYAYSIGELKPDAVVWLAQGRFGDAPKYLQVHGGYKLLPNGIWVSTRSRLKIDYEKLGACYWHCAD